jgi:hypothetical protein
MNPLRLNIHTIQPGLFYYSTISKGQGYQGFLKEKGREQFGQENGNLRCTRKNFKNEKN